MHASILFERDMYDYLCSSFENRIFAHDVIPFGWFSASQLYIFRGAILKFIYPCNLKGGDAIYDSIFIVRRDFWT